MEIKDLKKEDRPRERFERLGVKALADYEIMAIIIGSGGKNNSVLEMAVNVINQIDLKDFEHITIRELEKIKGKLMEFNPLTFPLFNYILQEYVLLYLLYIDHSYYNKNILN